MSQHEGKQLTRTNHLAKAQRKDNQILSKEFSAMIPRASRMVMVYQMI